MTRIDISQAYFHVPIAESHRQLLRLVYDKELLQMTSLPFGLSSAPHTFAVITNWVAETLRARGMRVVVYLDDFLLASQDRARLSSQTTEAVQLLQFLGWQVNHNKCVTTPSQEIEFLGIVWNTHKNLISLPEKKIQKIRDLSKEIQRRGSATLKQTQCLLGLLNFANFAVHRGRLHCRHLQKFSTEFRQGRLRERRPIPQAVEAELRWWCEASTSNLHKREITHFLTTDAADTGWGAQLEETLLSGNWSAEQKKWHSNRKEMYAVYAAIKHEAHFLRKAHVLVQTDNRTLVAYIQKEGGTRSLDLLNLTFKLLKLVDSLHIELSAAYLPGRYNGIADRLSRKKALPEWHLLPEATERIFERWGVPDIDLFASERTAVVKRYVSRDSRDQCASFTDAFSRSWDCKLGWVFPPPSLIPKVLAHLNKCRGQVLIVAPKWERTFWMSDLEQRSREPPMTIEGLERVLIDVTTQQPPPKVEHLCLQVWKIGCGVT